jgi:hypothetical protein
LWKLDKKCLKNWARWLMPIILATLQIEIGRLTAGSQPGQKVSENPISTNKLGVVLGACEYSYIGGTVRRISFQG